MVASESLKRHGCHVSIPAARGRARRRHPVPTAHWAGRHRHRPRSEIGRHARHNRSSGSAAEVTPANPNVHILSVQIARRRRLRAGSRHPGELSTIPADSSPLGAGRTLNRGSARLGVGGIRRCAVFGIGEIGVVLGSGDGEIGGGARIGEEAGVTGVVVGLRIGCRSGVAGCRAFGSAGRGRIGLRLVVASIGLAAGIGVAVDIELRPALHSSAGRVSGLPASLLGILAAKRGPDPSDPGRDAGTGGKKKGSPDSLFIVCPAC